MTETKATEKTLNKPQEITAPYFKIESFSTLDGPGIRLVVFLCGCHYRCIFCHNPEGWAKGKNKKELITPQQIVKMWKKNQSFYADGGGITLSGGEPLIHKEFVLKLAKLCYNKISLVIQTSGCNLANKANVEFLQKLCKYKPLFIVDIKAVSAGLHKKITQTIPTSYELATIEFLEKAKVDFWASMVLVPGLTDDVQEWKKIKTVLTPYKHLSKFLVLPFHQYGAHKYAENKIEYSLANAQAPTEAETQKAREFFSSLNK